MCGSDVGLLVPTWAGSLDHPRTTRETQDRTLGSRGCCCPPNCGTAAGITPAHRFRFGSVPTASESRSRNPDSPCPRYVSRCCFCGWHHWPACASPESPHLRNGNAPLRGKLHRAHAVTRPQEPGHDPAISRNHSARSTTRVPPGAFSSAPPCPIPTSFDPVFLRTRRLTDPATYH